MKRSMKLTTAVVLVVGALMSAPADSCETCAGPSDDQYCISIAGPGGNTCTVEVKCVGGSRVTDLLCSTICKAIGICQGTGDRPSV